MIHPQYRKFIADWNGYEFMTSSLVQQTSNCLFIAWDEIVQNNLVNSNRGFFKAIEQVVTKIANLAVHWMNFGSLMQHENEPIKDFLVLLRYMAVDCEFICPAYSHGLSNSNIKDQFLRAFQNEILQTELLAKASQLKTIEEIVQHAEAFETSVRDQSQLQTLAKHKQHEYQCIAETNSSPDVFLSLLVSKYAPDMAVQIMVSSTHLHDIHTVQRGANFVRHVKNLTTLL